MKLKLKKYKLPMLVLVVFSLLIPSFVFSYANINIKDIDIKKLDDGKISVEWETNLKTSGIVRYGQEDIALSHRKYEDKGDSTKHEVIIDDLNDGELYYFQIEAKNSVKTVRSEMMERYIEVIPAKRAIASDLKVDSVSKKSSATEAKIGLGTNLPSEGTLVVKKNSKLIKTVNLPRDINHEVVVTELEPNTCYDFYLNLRDDYNDKYSNTYGLCTLRKSVLPVSREGDWDYDMNEVSPLALSSTDGIIVAGIDYARYPTIQAVYKTSDSDKVWLIMNNQRHLVSNETAFYDYGLTWAEVETVPWPIIHQYDEVKLARKRGTDQVYFLHHRTDGTIAKILIPSAVVFDSYKSNDREDIVVISDYDLNSYPNVKLVQSISNGYLYYVSGNVKHYIAKDILAKYKYNTAEILPVSTIHLSRYETGDGLK